MSTEQTQRCSRCAISKPVTAFMTVYGRVGRCCDDCRRYAQIRNKHRQARAAEERLGRVPGQPCVCGRCGDVVEFADVDNGRGGTFQYCKPCREKGNKRRQIVIRFSQEQRTPCAECGDDILINLQLAHVSREHKRRCVGECGSIAAAMDESLLTRTLCFKCHAVETRSEEVKQNGEERYPARCRRRSLVMDYIMHTYDGQCQFPGCAFSIKSDSAAEVRRCMHMDHQPSQTKTRNISDLVQRGPDEALCTELSKCVPLCQPHHMLISRFRARCPKFREFCVHRKVVLPEIMARAASATVSNPDAWTRAF